MLPESRRRIEATLDEHSLVLDVGGGANPFPRADWVIDLLRYEDRGLFGDPIDPAGERFSHSTWVSRDICSREPWPFADKQFDFAICSHTLEDVRDPIAVCDELVRVARAGYIEVPSRLEEQSYGFQGPWTGWGHHRWLIDIDQDEITFVFKHHVLHNRDSDRFPEGFQASLALEQRVQCLWWTDNFRYREQIFLDGPSLDGYLNEFIERHRPPRLAVPRWRRFLRRLRHV